mmetsp:Transcript_14222/g.21871  ORF Transcript_14222/g.21871 Transcript_14222/m.21871 type:complete len:118 (+) Transcript_14222:2747-3100(+)
MTQYQNLSLPTIHIKPNRPLILLFASAYASCLHSRSFYKVAINTRRLQKKVATAKCQSDPKRKLSGYFARQNQRILINQTELKHPDQKYSTKDSEIEVRIGPLFFEIPFIGSARPIS